MTALRIAKCVAEFERWPSCPGLLQEKDAWICGLRKDQSVSRFFNKMVEWDENNGLVKINPLINWTEKDVWDYIKEHKIPYNLLHDRGFPSIGCEPCTRAVEPGEDITGRPVVVGK